LALAGQVGIEVVRADEVFDVEEGGPLLADVDEGRLHARQDAAHLPHVDVAEGAPLAVPLEVELGDDSVFDERDARLTDVDVDDEDVLGHGAGSRRCRPERGKKVS
jgi:hypothetical protein